jgi:dephospho-CoA kinase
MENRNFKRNGERLMMKAIVTVGVSASGKTTFAESFLQEDVNIVLKQQCTKEEEQQGLLIPVFRDGDVLIDEDFVTVRSRAGYIQY